MAYAESPPAGVGDQTEKDDAPRGPGLPARILAPAGALARGARHVAVDPRTLGVLRAGPKVASFMVTSRRRTRGGLGDDTVIPVRATPGLAAQAYLDEVLIAAFRHPGLLPAPDDFAPAARALAASREHLDRRGYLDDPAAYHRPPPLPAGLEVSAQRGPMARFDHLTWDSGWAPEPDEPGAADWGARPANRRAGAFVARAPGRDRGRWVVCVHGFGMGASGTMDLQAFRAARLHQLGLHVAVPVLPLHGARANGRVRGEDLMTIDLVNAMHGMAQAVWDTRALVRWLRQTQGAEEVAILGLSLGGLVAAVCAALDPYVGVVAGIPVVDLPDLFRRHSPDGIRAEAERHGVLGPLSDDVHRVVSPLAMDCRVPVDRRYVFAGLGDRMSTFGQARRLWLHWDQPHLAAYAGGHVGFFFSAEVRRFLEAAFTEMFHLPVPDLSEAV